MKYIVRIKDMNSTKIVESDVYEEEGDVVLLEIDGKMQLLPLRFVNLISVRIQLIQL